MAHPNEELLRQAFAAFQSGDMEALQTKYFAEDIRYHVPGRSPLAGTYEGTAAVLGFFGRTFELTGGTLSIDLHDVLANDDHGVALYTLRAERGGKQIADNHAMIAHANADGKAAEVWIHSSDTHAFDEFWS